MKSSDSGVLLGRNNFYSSGQIPLDLVNEGVLNRFGTSILAMVGG